MTVCLIFRLHADTLIDGIHQRQRFYQVYIRFRLGMRNQTEIQCL